VRGSASGSRSQYEKKQSSAWGSLARNRSIRMFLDIPRLYLLKWGHEVGV